MFATFFLAIGALFFWMLFQGLTDREIKGRGWGFSVRVYGRDTEPVMYWITFASYLVCALGSTVFGLLMALKLLPQRGA
jgi:hypothetical protein